MKTFVILLILFVIFAFAVSTDAQTTEFNYQGSLKLGTPPNTVPANGNYDFEFALFDALSSGTQLGSTITRNGVVITNGTFAVNLDFGSQFPGANRFLEIRVRNAGGGPFTTLTPRQQINSSPYSVRSLSADNATNAATATNATQLGGVAANQYLRTNGNGSALTNLNAGSISTGTLAIANGGTGSTTKNFVDLSTDQTSIGGNKSFSGNVVVNSKLGVGTNPSAKLEVVDPLNNGLRVQTNSSGGTVASFGGAGAFQIDASGSPGGRFTVLENGSVGIGMSNPNSKLHVFGTGGLRIAADSDSNAGFGLRLNNTPKWSIATASPGQLQVFNDALGQNAVWIDPANNNVGIGTNTPAGKFHINVSGSGNPISALTVDVGTFGTGSNAVNSYYFKARDLGAGGIPAFLIRGDGNVGIGVSDPSFFLDVGQRMRLRSGGNNNVSAGLYFNDNANNIAAFAGMQDDTHVGLWGSGTGWQFGMNTATGALRVNGNDGSAGQVITSNGASPAQWKSPTNSLYQQTNISASTGAIAPGGTLTTIPGLSQTITVSGNAKLLVQFGVRIEANDCCFGATAWIELFLNGGNANAIQKGVGANTRDYISGNWLFSVGPGTHTIEVKAFSDSLTGAVLAYGGFGLLRSNLIVQVIPE